MGEHEDLASFYWLTSCFCSHCFHWSQLYSENNDQCVLEEAGLYCRLVWVVATALALLPCFSQVVSTGEGIQAKVIEADTCVQLVFLVSHFLSCGGLNFVGLMFQLLELFI